METIKTKSAEQIANEFKRYALNAVNGISISSIYNDNKNWNYYAAIAGRKNGNYFDLYFMENKNGKITIEIAFTTSCVREMFDIIKIIAPNQQIKYYKTVYTEIYA
jgi:hypothetical protein